MKNFLSLISHLSSQKGFTVIEVVIAMAFMVLMLGLVTINFGTVQRQGSLSTALETLITDLSQQQIKAMVGDTEGRVANDDYGIKINSTNYTLFHGIYSALESTNFSINLPSTVQFDPASRSEIVFKQLSGEVDQYDNDSNQIILQDTISGDKKVIIINKYGVITEID